MDQSGFIYVADTYNSRIQKFSSEGVFIAKWGTDATDALEVSRSGVVYAAGQGLGRIESFTTGGTFLSSWDSAGPTGLAIGSDETIYVSRGAGDPAITQCDTDGSVLAQWGIVGSAPEQLNGPLGLAIDQSGNVYVADHLNNRIQKFTGAGVWLTGWGVYGAGPGEFIAPGDVAVDSEYNVYVADVENARIQKFSDSPVPATVTTWGRIKAERR